MRKTPCAVIGTGNIGTDLMYKLLDSEVLDLRYMIGIDEQSDGLARARAAGVESSSRGIEWLLTEADDVELAFDATSASIHQIHAPLLAASGITAVDMTPAALGPAVVPTVNLGDHIDSANVNMITCGGQATVPIVAAVTSVTDVVYAEMVSTIASRSAGPGTRSNIDQFTQTTARGLESIGGADCGKAIIILNPADPPILMRNTVYCGLPAKIDRDQVVHSLESMVAAVQEFVPGYRLRSEPLFDTGPFETPGGSVAERVTVLVEVVGAGDYLPSFAGNLDIMTAAAVRVAEMLSSEESREHSA